MPPGAGGGGGGQSQNDNSLSALWIVMGIFFAGAMIWFYFQKQIIAFVIAVRAYEVTFISFFIPHGWSQRLMYLQAYIHNIQTTHPTLTIDDLVNLSNAVGEFFLYPALIILLGLAVLVYVAHVTFRYKKTYSMTMLIENEKDNWPQILPVVKLDLIKEPIDVGPWAMSQTPMAFAKKNNLIIEEKAVADPGKLLSKAIITATINRDEARKIFAMQLGTYWTNVESLPIHTQALFAAFAARINGDRDSTAKLLEQISRSSATGKLDFTGTKEMLIKYKDTKLITKILKKHAFVLTVMATILEVAREDGVLPSADFLWLKPIDRRLWYMLNSVGRQTAFPEVSGPFAHWLVEKELNRRLNIPMVEEAVNALEVAIKEFIYKPDEPED